MPYFDRFDICEAYQQIETDYNVSGVLQERKSNQRRKMSTGYQLWRMQYRRGLLPVGMTFSTENAKEIYNQLEKEYGFK